MGGVKPCVCDARHILKVYTRDGCELRKFRALLRDEIAGGLRDVSRVSIGKVLFANEVWARF